MATKRLGRPPVQINPGDRYGRLTIVKEAPRARGSARRFECLCDCGNVRIYEMGDFRCASERRTKSCGCLGREKHTVHGKHGCPEYYCWKGMNQRCSNPNSPQWKDYGGRGIEVCRGWRESFTDFLKDMGPRPSPLHSIERKNNSNGYYPDNCKWATRTEQNRNSRKNVMTVELAARIRLERASGIRPRDICKNHQIKKWVIYSVLSRKTWA